MAVDVRYIKGVGPRKASDLSRLGIKTAGDLIYYMPRRHEDRSRIEPIEKLKAGEIATVKGKIVRHGVWKSKKGVLIYEMVVSDKTGSVHCVWYNQPYLKRHFAVGRDIILHGRIERFRNLQLAHPDYEILDREDDYSASVNMGRIVPIYPLTANITQRYLRSIIARILGENLRHVKEALPTYVRARHKLTDIRFALQNIHFPHKIENLRMAYHRLAFEEFMVLETALALVKRKRAEETEGVSHEVKGHEIDIFTRMLPFKLTQGQMNALKEVEQDMRRPKTMNRLIQGDVGSGKTVVAMYALFLTIRNGLQGVLMVPTETLAQQHYLSVGEFFMPLGINVRLLIGSTEKKEKERIKTELSEGAIDIIIGTHSLIQEDISLDKAGLIVVDEQHKFGVSQRSMLKKKGAKADILLMTATPIPRTLALTAYGDLDITSIKELPEGRQPISTFWVEDSRKDKVYKFVKEEVAKGHQAYIVCPRIEEEGLEELSSAKGLFENLRKNEFADIEIRLLHGRMQGKVKESVMRDFKKNKISVLVSTVLVEVGIDVPNVTVMVIENADRFGLSQLHQLRGRIGRGEHRSYCILTCRPRTEDAKRRLEAFENSADGFELAEEDLLIRGPGDILGTRQHGLPGLRFGDLIEDRGILEEARKEAFELVEGDSGLREERHAELREAVIARYKGRMKFLNVG